MPHRSPESISFVNMQIGSDVIRLLFCLSTNVLLLPHTGFDNYALKLNADLTFLLKTLLV